jgi:two-component system, OmpR family, KDP operon response regulator KdpE
MAGERILVCDDDPQIRKALGQLLRAAGYEALTAGSAEEALDRAALARPHLAIVDVMLPDGNGIELCRSLRDWSEIPILILSAIGDEQTKIEALDAGADDYITKPFGQGELAARVHAALRRAGGEPSEPRVQAGGVTVDLKAHAVWLNGDEVRLTPTEFALLRVLVLNRGLLMTHRQLLTEVWGPEYADATPVLRTHIANLRAKLAAGVRGPPPIRTDPGIGYRFVS